MDSSQSEQGLFDIIELNQFNGRIESEKLPISLFQEVKADLCDKFLHSSSPENDQADRALDFIQKIVDNVREEFETKKFTDRWAKTFLTAVNLFFQNKKQNIAE